MWLAALTAKAWFKPALILVLGLAVVLGFVYLLKSYGDSQYQLGRSDKQNEVLQAQAKQLTTLIAKVQEIGNTSNVNAGNQADRMAALETSANKLIEDAGKRVLLIPGPDGKCRMTDDWRNAWNKANQLVGANPSLPMLVPAKPAKK